MEAYRRLEVKNIGISRRRTQTFSSADLAEENRLALRAGEMSSNRRSDGEGAIGSSSRSDCTFKLRRSRSLKPMQQNSKAFSARLRLSACVCGKKMAPALVDFLNPGP